MLSSSVSSLGRAVSSPTKEMMSIVTNMKLEEIKIQQTRMLDHYKRVKNQVAGTSNRTAKLRFLYDGMKTFAIAGTLVHTNLQNVEALITQSGLDPTISQDLLEFWIKRLTAEINRCEKRWEYAHLFGGLLSEYVRAENMDWEMTDEVESVVDSSWSLASDRETDKTVSESYAKTEKEFYRVFKMDPVDVEAVKKFLVENPLKFEANNIYGDGEAADWKYFIDEMKEFGEYLLTEKVETDDVSLAIKSLLKNDLLSKQKKDILKDFQDNETILNEFAAIMTLMLAKIRDGEWNWPEQGVFADVRAAVGGRHRVFLDYDLCNALFLEFVGLKWCIEFRVRMQTLVTKGKPKADQEIPPSIWKLPAEHVRSNVKLSVNQRRAKMFSDIYFLNMLPKSEEEVENGPGMYDELRESSSGHSEALPMQKLIQLIATEASVHQALYSHKPFTVVKTDLESFGLSLNHNLVLTIMESFGVTVEWLAFFRVFLECPVTIKGKISTCKQGTPIAHLISRVMGEMVLVMMDLHVNRKTGVLLHRIHDDIWFWSNDEQVAVDAWTAMTEIARVFGLSFNAKKSGSASIFNATPPATALSSIVVKTPSGDCVATYGPSPLPQHVCEWGFLTLCSNDGRFHVNKGSDTNFLTYAQTMKKKLESAKSVLTWVNVCNEYVRFFLRNFGKISPIFGLSHVDEIVSVVKTVYEIVFDTTGDIYSGKENDLAVTVANPVTVVKEIIKKRFPEVAEEKIPDAWFHWPITAGGLGLVNPFIDLMACRMQVNSEINLLCSETANNKAVHENYFSLLKHAEKVTYECELETWNDKEQAEVEKRADSFNLTPYTAKPFLDYEEWCLQYRFSRSDSKWARRYEGFVAASDLAPVEPQSSSELAKLVADFISRGKSLVASKESRLGNRGLKPYWRWVLAYYGPELMETFGSLEFMNVKLIPMGMIGALKKQGVEWD